MHEQKKGKWVRWDSDPDNIVIKAVWESIKGDITNKDGHKGYGEIKIT